MVKVSGPKLHERAPQPIRIAADLRTPHVGNEEILIGRGQFRFRLRCRWDAGGHIGSGRVRAEPRRNQNGPPPLKLTNPKDDIESRSQELQSILLT